MDYDRTLDGDGPYPLTGPWAVLARLAFLIAVLAILTAIFLPERLVPHFVRSHFLQHFAAFYVLAVFAMMAAPRTRLRTVALWLVVFVTVLEAGHLAVGLRPKVILDNWISDVGGLAAGLAPAFAERFRRRFRRPAD